MKLSQLIACLVGTAGVWGLFLSADYNSWDSLQDDMPDSYWRIDVVGVRISHRQGWVDHCWEFHCDRLDQHHYYRPYGGVPIDRSVDIATGESHLRDYPPLEYDPHWNGVPLLGND